MKIESKIFNEYKPFRNWISQFDVDTSLYVIWAYSRFLKYNHPLPPNIHHKNIFPTRDIVKKRLNIIAEWELNFIASEIIAYGSSPVGKKSFLNYNDFRRTMIKLRKLDDQVGSILVQKYGIQELRRLGFRQFLWQSARGGNLMRYYKIYCNSDLNNLVKSKTSMPVEDIFKYSLLLEFYFSQRFTLTFPIPEFKEQANKNLETILNILSGKFSEMKSILKSSKENYLNLFYYKDFLKINPIIIFKSKTICPIIDNISHQSINGLYYMINSDDGFDNSFGQSFESYVGEVIKMADENKKFDVYPEMKYGKNKKSIDWLIRFNDVILFIECKTKRPTLLTQTSIHAEDIALDKLKIIEMITQVYKSLNDFVNNKYPFLNYKDEYKIYPTIITLEDWFIFMFENFDEIEGEVKKQLNTLEIPLEFLEKYPYYLFSCNDFEHDIQYMCHYGIEMVMDSKYSRAVKNRKELEPIRTKILFDEDRLKMLEELKTEAFTNNKN